MITEKKRQILQHILGAGIGSLKRNWGFRNHYVTNENSPQHVELLEMEKLGLVKGGGRLGQQVFWATKAGGLAIGFKPAQLRRTSFAD